MFVLTFRWLIGFTSVSILFIAISAAIGNGYVGYPSGEVFYRLLERFCHQFPTLSFHIADHPLGLCARCTGGYLGTFVGAACLSYVLQRHGVLQTYAVSITIFLIAVVEALIHPTDANLWRFSSGFLGGTGAVLAFLCLAITAQTFVLAKLNKH